MKGMEMKTLKELYLEAARVAEMIEGTKLTIGDCVKFEGGACGFHPQFNNASSWYEFALAIVEGKPVFNGDELYDEYGNRYPIQTYSLSNGVSYLNGYDIKKWYLNPPTRTVMVELLVEDASYVANVGLVNTKMVEACRKALEGLK